MRGPLQTNVVHVTPSHATRKLAPTYCTIALHASYPAVSYNIGVFSAKMMSSVGTLSNVTAFQSSAGRPRRVLRAGNRYYNFSRFQAVLREILRRASAKAQHCPSAHLETIVHASSYFRCDIDAHDSTTRQKSF